MIHRIKNGSYKVVLKMPIKDMNYRKSLVPKEMNAATDVPQKTL